MSQASTIHALVADFYETFTHKDPKHFRELLAPNWQNHPADYGREPDVSGFIEGVNDLRTALSGLTIQREATVVDGDLAVCRIVVSGVHKAPFAGIAPTFKPAQFHAMDMHRIENGKIAETWHFERLSDLTA